MTWQDDLHGTPYNNVIPHQPQILPPNQGWLIRYIMHLSWTHFKSKPSYLPGLRRTISVRLLTFIHSAFLQHFIMCLFRLGGLDTRNVYEIMI